MWWGEDHLRHPAWGAVSSLPSVGDKYVLWMPLILGEVSPGVGELCVPCPQARSALASGPRCQGRL